MIQIVSMLSNTEVSTITNWQQRSDHKVE